MEFTDSKEEFENIILMADIIITQPIKKGYRDREFLSCLMQDQKPRLSSSQVSTLTFIIPI
ncbi:hypothetical protein EBS02_10820 [bacterium]|nr:hypothetical protein [bacterium]